MGRSSTPKRHLSVWKNDYDSLLILGYSILPRKAVPIIKIKIIVPNTQANV
ncbi:hypothetical protein E4U09_003699 [Claviceps aff. purpurea]|uniref:Uncharacterized protein n=1 Tax=Claviceps aff. purpurea TaxID=1967640 RepID=A0A9P7QG02_9HYPO|nr:hypothetical protein E4U09_003699 [Claviceps aff. purpurea]